MTYVITYTHTNSGEQVRHLYKQTEGDELLKKFFDLRRQWYAKDLKIFKLTKVEISPGDILGI